ncbi:MAG: alanine dehydrogenase [Chitinophagales bacterium]|jgi:alanine dehydrogenase|nr:alanine dehydrogenase [Chitinophagales bacterium]
MSIYQTIEPAAATKLDFSKQEEPSLVTFVKGDSIIGIPRERTFQEHRVALTPESVKTLIHLGNKVIIESGAGNFSNYHDRSYSEAGAEIVYDFKEVYKSDIVVKVTPPSLEELEYMKKGQILFSPLHLPSLSKGIVSKMIEKQITGIAYEYLQDDWGLYPIVRAMSEIAGISAVQIASELLSNSQGGIGKLFGGIAGVPNTRLVILGAGTVAETAARIALGLGASVKVFDNSIYKLHRLQNNLNQRIFTSIISPEILSQELLNADVVIGAMHAKKGRTPIIISENMISKMMPNSVIIDVSIDQGGCFETSRLTTHDEPTFRLYDVIHYCVPNISSRVSRTASIALSNILTNTLIALIENQGIKNLIQNSKGFRNGVYVFNGNITNYHFSQFMNERFIDLDLLFMSDL